MASRCIRGLLFSTFLLWTTSSWAAPIALDQFYIPTSPDDGLIAEANQTVAQTFTVGLAGVLTAIELDLTCCVSPTGAITSPTDLLIEIRTTLPDGTPSDHVLATTVARSKKLSKGSFAFERFALGRDRFSVLPGELLAIVLSSTEPGVGFLDPYAWHSDGGQYDGGFAYVQHPLFGNEFSLAGRDMGFKTYVRPAPEHVRAASEQVRAAPEPASVTLMAVGAAAAIARARIVQRRRARRRVVR